MQQGLPPHCACSTQCCTDAGDANTAQTLHNIHLVCSCASTETSGRRQTFLSNTPSNRSYRHGRPEHPCSDTCSPTCHETGRCFLPMFGSIFQPARPVHPRKITNARCTVARMTSVHPLEAGVTPFAPLVHPTLPSVAWATRTQGQMSLDTYGCAEKNITNECRQEDRDRDSDCD